MKNKIVTIFGGTGFIGRYVVNALAHEGYSIRVVTRNPERAKDLRTAGFVGQVVPVTGNIRNTELLPELVKNSYAVVNLVGVLFESGKQKFSKLHTVAAGKLAEAAKEAGVERFVHISAIVDQESPSRYAQTKLAGEKEVLSAFPEAFIMKPNVVFGPEDNFINKFAALSKVLPFLPLIGCGETKFQPVYVGDVANAVKIAVDGAVKPSTYQLSGPETLTFKEILERINSYTHRKPGFINIPFGAAKLLAFFSPSAVLTRDQVTLLQSNCVATSRSRGFGELGIKPTALDAILPHYVARYAVKVRPESI